MAREDWLHPDELRAWHRNALLAHNRDEFQNWNHVHQVYERWHRRWEAWERTRAPNELPDEIAERKLEEFNNVFALARLRR